MSYYTGRGDYYSGKGDFGSLLGGIIGTAGKIASAVVPGVGGLIGAGASAISGVLSGTGSVTVPTVPQSTGIALPFGPTIPQVSGGGGGSCGSGQCNSGYHLNKTDHYNRQGFVPARSTCVRNRKTNYTNPRALARAAKRMDGFVGVARKALKSTNYKVVAKSFRANYRKPLKR